MHVSVVGAGALGRIYGITLASVGARVSFRVRPNGLADRSPFTIEQVNGDHRRHVLDHPERVSEIPADADAILVTVRFDQLLADSGDDDLIPMLRRGPSVPVIVLTPLLPAQLQGLTAALGRRVIAAMPGVAGYLDDRGVVRYWRTSVAATLFEDRSEAEGILDQIARRLTRAGLPTRLDRDVAALDAATTVAFFPLVASLSTGGGVDGVLADKDLFATVLEAAAESESLARQLGKAASWTHLLMKFVGPYTIKPGVALARRLFPETVRFAEQHFGPKLRGQHLAMGRAILELGRERGAAMPALTRLVTRLERTPSSNTRA